MRRTRMSRRRFHGALLGGAGVLMGGAAQGEEHALSSFDREVEAFMKERGVPGGALAVVRDRKLVYAKGYGWADREAQVPATPESLFRIASISKPITAVAVLQLVERGKLSLDDHAFDLLHLNPILAPDHAPDPRLKSVTVRHLLHHTGGWDRDQSFDPMFRPRVIAHAAGEKPPAGPKAVIRYMLGQPLDFDPGTREAYSNFGYCVLGRIIEKLSGLTYEEYVKRHVLVDCGVRRMRIGASLPEGKAAGEVHYYMPKPELVDSVFGEEHHRVPWPYGGFYLEAMDSHGGWIASAVDLARFAAALDYPEQSPLLKYATIKTMYEPPAPPVERKHDKSGESWYACGWSVRPREGRANYWHSGSLPGTNTLLVRRWDGLTWAVLFNQRTRDPALPDTAIDGALHHAAAEVKTWPTADLFPKYR